MKLNELMMEEKNEKEPDGTYAGYRFHKDDLKTIREWAKGQGIPNRIPTKKIHCTLLYSRKHCPDYEPAGEINPPKEATIKKGYEVWPTQDGKHALVVCLDAPFMNERHKELMDKHNASFDYDEYKPHITLSYDVGKDFDVDKLGNLCDEVPSLRTVEEYGEDLVLDWQNKGK